MNAVFEGQMIKGDRGYDNMNIGETAPDFVLKDQHGEEIRLKDLRGKKVVLSFHPLAWTSVCAQQMQSLEAQYEAFENAGAVALGISVDSVPCKKAWAESLGIEKTRLLADFWPHGGVADMYGILRKEGFSERANIIVDEEGTIIFFKRYELSHLPDIQEILAALR